MSLLFILSAGFLVGMKHATEPDHVAAVATLASGRQTLAQALLQGAAWGIGHATTLMVLGSIVLALGKSIPPGMTLALEFAVAAMLIALGGNVLLRLRRQNIDFHAHRCPSDDQQAQDHARGLPLRALTVGMMHGMAGSAALILLSLEAVESHALGLAYIALFGLGSIVGMALLSVAMSVPLRFLAAARLVWLHKGATAAVGAFSCMLGIAMGWRVGVAGGMFS